MFRSEELCQAAGHGDVAEMDRLIRAGADVNFEFDGSGGSTPLSFAVFNGHVDAARFLVNHGAVEMEGMSSCGSLLHDVSPEMRKLLLATVCKRVKTR